MEPIDHLEISFISSLALSSMLFRLQPQTLLLIAAATAAGTLIDLDHFLIARLRGGNRYIRKAIMNPLTTFTSHKEVLDDIEDDVPAATRLVSHGLITAAAAAFLTPVDWRISVLFTSVLSLHILADFYHSYL